MTRYLYIRGMWTGEKTSLGKWYSKRFCCGGNLVIPGTDKNSILYRRLASDMGLAITHHHSEPLGSEMFARAYPDLTPSFAKYPEKFRRLWQDGIEAQQGMNVVWNIGLRSGRRSVLE